MMEDAGETGTTDTETGGSDPQSSVVSSGLPRSQPSHTTVTDTAPCTITPPTRTSHSQDGALLHMEDGTNAKVEIIRGGCLLS